MPQRGTLLVTAGILLAAATAWNAGDTGPDATLTRAGLAADVDLLQRAYEQLHPGLYRYNTPEHMRGHFQVLRRALDRDQSLSDAYLAFSQFAAKVRCGHTYPNFYNQPKPLQHALFERGNRVPFEFRWLDGRMIVTRDLTGVDALPRGTEILAITGVPVGRILERLLTVARADGSNDAKRTALLEVSGQDGYETFDVYLRLFFPQVDGPMALEVRRPGTKGSQSIPVAALSHAQRVSARRQGADDETGGWTLDVSRTGVAVMRMPTWALYRSRWDWKAFVREAFEQIAARGMRALVIDLRGNEGGIDVGDEILPHLIDRALELPEPARRVRYRTVPADLAPMLDTWDASFKDWGDAAQRHDELYFTLTRGQDRPQATLLRPRSPRFNGRVFLLVGATNSSATFQFADQVQRFGLGTLVGQPTGGNRRGINGGAFFFLRLPNSRIEMDLPLIATFPPGDPPDAGLLPDIAVTPNIAEIASGRDVEMEVVLAALENAR